MPNQLECTVLEVIGEPKYHAIPDQPYWTVKVKYDCYGQTSDFELYFSTKKDAKKVKVGYIFKEMF